MSWKLTYEQETSPGYGIYLQTRYGHSFTLIELIKELNKLKGGRPILKIRVSYNSPNFRALFWPKCGDCGSKFNTEYCQECCEHEHDPDEGMMCINCNKEWDGP